VTLRVVEGFPKLRQARALRWIRRCLQLAHKQRFAVVQFSVQGNHLHLIIEAEDRRALSRGMQGLTIRLAKRLNLLFGTRGGTVFAERYHAQPLGNPRQVRSALAYVLGNRRKHLAQSGRRMPSGHVDPFSSAPHFDGWARPVWCSARLVGEAVTKAPRTWLLRVGWRRLGLLDPDAIPGAAGGRRLRRHRV
jgi:REP element-mobilizing transposase RayT